jgi:hypothetical protein
MLSIMEEDDCLGDFGNCEAMPFEYLIEGSLD